MKLKNISIVGTKAQQKFPGQKSVKNILNIAIVTAKAAIVNENRNQTTINRI